MSSNRRRSKPSTKAALLPALLLALALPSSAHASPDTFRMALANILWGPVDTALSPVTAGLAVKENLPLAGDDLGEQLAYAIPGYGGLVLLGIGTGCIRAVSGALQMIPAIPLFPFPSIDLPEELDPFGQGPALVDAENPLGKEPPWLAYVLPVTPFTIDAKLGILYPFAVYSTDVEGSQDQVKETP